MSPRHHVFSLLSAFLLGGWAALSSGLLPAPVHAGEEAGRLGWKCSTADHLWADRPAVAVHPGVAVPKAGSGPTVYVDSRRPLQVIDGWGGCFNERGWKAMEVLDPAAREALLHALFDPQTGLRLNLCRTPIGASDYAITLYSLDETPGDYALEHFSIARDQEKLIPYIKAALAIRPDLRLWAVPWSPPSWMKDSGQLAGGSIKDDDRTLDALARYFARYVQAYRAAGVNVGMVMPQNEPAVKSRYTSCLWTSEQLSKFIGYHLGPTFQKEHVDADIFFGTINESGRGGYAYWIAPSLQDPQTRRYVKGVGCQWAGTETMLETHFVQPELKLMQSETECGQTNSNDWAFGQKQYDLAMKWFGAGASSNIIWNLVLDETGKSTADWAQCSPVVVDSKSGQVTYTPFYYCYRHFSAYVQPGAHVVPTQGEWKDRVAFVNPDGGVVVVMANSSNNDLPVNLSIDGRQSEPVVLPAHSFDTFTCPAGM